MKKKYTTILTSIILLSIFGCSKEGTKTSSSSESNKASIGQTLVKQNCRVCHAQGINGAPIIGNKNMWSQRLAKGEKSLIENAINGFGLMPPKGGKSQLSDDDIATAVKYMLEQVQ